MHIYSRTYRRAYYTFWTDKETTRFTLMTNLHLTRKRADPPARSFHPHQKHSSDNSGRNEEDRKFVHVELTAFTKPLSRQQRRNLLASVGFLDDNEELPEHGSSQIHFGECTRVHGRSFQKMVSQKKRTTFIGKLQEHMELTSTPSHKHNQYTSHETLQGVNFGGDESSQDDNQLIEDDSESVSFPQQDQDHSIKRKFCVVSGKLICAVAALILVGVFRYSDTALSSSIEDSTGDIYEKEGLLKYSLQKDENIPDDRETIIQSEFIISSSENTDWNKFKDRLDNVNNLPQHKHGNTGIYQVDSLWNDLDGYADVLDPYHSDQDLAVFWHVPKVGGTSLQDIMIHCFGMIGANEIGGHYVKTSDRLEVVKLDNGNRYINVDMSNPSGILHAHELGLGQSESTDVVITSWFHDAAILFKNNGSDKNVRRGRCFTLLRHPIQRAVSMFYYLRNATWEHTFNEVYKTMTIEEYAISKYSEDNWMVRFLTNEMSGALQMRHLDLAKQILESKCLIGLTEEFAQSFKRFDDFFGWSHAKFEGGPVELKNRQQCLDRVMMKPDNVHPHPTLEEGSDVWNILLKKNSFDLSLYIHAVNLFYNVQGKLVNKYS